MPILAGRDRRSNSALMTGALSSNEGPTGARSRSQRIQTSQTQRDSLGSCLLVRGSPSDSSGLRHTFEASMTCKRSGVRTPKLHLRAFSLTVGINRRRFRVGSNVQPVSIIARTGRRWTPGSFWPGMRAPLRRPRPPTRSSITWTRRTWPAPEPGRPSASLTWRGCGAPDAAFLFRVVE